jgi:prepilin-type N-terminal cleavage/methylation domain-containing protein
MASTVPHPHNRDSSGFTLIEMAMVLVIIGLIVGAVLVGRDMIQAAEVRAQVSQIDHINAAVQTFRDKYNCLPGDCAKGSDFGFQGLQYNGGSSPFDNNGDGNGRIGVDPITLNSVPGHPDLEINMFWNHLIDAGFIKAN